MAPQAAQQCGARPALSPLPLSALKVSQPRREPALAEMRISRSSHSARLCTAATHSAAWSRSMTSRQPDGCAKRIATAASAEVEVKLWR